MTAHVLLWVYGIRSCVGFSFRPSSAWPLVSRWGFSGARVLTWDVDQENAGGRDSGVVDEWMIIGACGD